MWLYFLKRLLIMLPTVFGVVTLTFIVTQFVPGGPIEQILMEAEGGNDRNAAEASGGGGMSYSAGGRVDDNQLRQLNEMYGFDKPVLERYWMMLVRFARLDLGESYVFAKTTLPDNSLLVILKGEGSDAGVNLQDYRFFRLQAPDRTLTDEDAATARQAVIDAVAGAHQAVLRG